MKIQGIFMFLRYYIWGVDFLTKNILNKKKITSILTIYLEIFLIKEVFTLEYYRYG
mgnify:CR=1 FL=1